MEFKERIKIAMICHFSNELVRKKLPLSKRTLDNRIRSLIGRQPYKYRDYSAWNTNLIHELEHFEDVELHAVVPHDGLKKKVFEFEMKGVFYHFFKPEDDILKYKISNRLNKKRQNEFLYNRKIITYLIKKINPDVINLVGAEAPFFSSSVLDIKDIPIFVSCQTVYTNPKRGSVMGNPPDKTRWNTELKIHQKEKYFGCTGRMHHDLILKNNPDSIIFKMAFLGTRPVHTKNVPKRFDFICFAKVLSDKKGIKDAIEAIYLVKKHKNDITLNISGTCSPKYRSELDEMIKNLNLQSNITFHDFFSTHMDMYQHIRKARFSVLPIKLDIISGTILDSIFLDIPVVTYKTSGTPTLNTEKECVLISEIGDIQGLASNMIKFIDSEELGRKLATDAKEYVTRVYDNTILAKRFVEDFKAVFNHYHFGTPIPGELLFDVNEFPIYA